MFTDQLVCVREAHVGPATPGRSIFDRRAERPACRVHDNYQICEISAVSQTVPADVCPFLLQKVLKNVETVRGRN